MPRHIPFGFLKTFAVAARHESFVRAAEELHVTPAAVSQQIRTIEAQLEAQLFLRGARSLKLTRQGAEFARTVEESLARITDAAEKLHRPDAAGQLVIGTFPSFAFGWLLPRLPDFRSRHPHISLRLETSVGLSEFGASGVDVAIRFGGGHYDNCTAVHLMDDFIVPACSPRLLGGRAAPHRVADIARLPLLDDESAAAEEAQLHWETWLGDSYDPRAMNRLPMPDGLFTLQAALLGQGAALVRKSLCADYLFSGELIQLLPREHKADFSYWIVVPEHSENRRVALFVDWISEQMEELRQRGDGTDRRNPVG